LPAARKRVGGEKPHLFHAVNVVAVELFRGWRIKNAALKVRKQKGFE